MPDYSTFTKALETAEGQPENVFDALYRLTDETIGVKLFTMMSFDFPAGVAGRFYSNMPDAYPVSGTKPVNTTDWARQVLQERQVFVANNIEGIAEVFYDHELIKSLGCESVINIPVVIGGNVIGTINCLHEADYYTEDKVAAAVALKLPGAVCFLLKERHKTMGTV
ncbi:GAF domain-containing protein [Chelativorans intermedius]|uniref:GAF domain-containing protein n=1 Tax=Chelativorans intermedius TaxID=515947 RepID=A0ABV6DCY9_9HYPH|nr:GAF domain-containing protein [Chelativorans intermedius]MCT9000526.1 GAF domain-containing protein [Chelativorans intermedius]